MSPNLIHNFMNLSSLLSLSVCNLALQHEKPGSCHPFINCLMLVYLHCGYRIVNQPHWENNYHLKNSSQVQFLLLLVLQTLHISKHAQIHVVLSSPTSMRQFHIFGKQLHDCVTLYSILVSPNLHNGILNFAYIMI